MSNQGSSLSATKHSEKHPYHTPCFTEWGLIVNVTRGTGTPITMDSDFTPAVSASYGPHRDPNLPLPPIPPTQIHPPVGG